MKYNMLFYKHFYLHVIEVHLVFAFYLMMMYLTGERSNISEIDFSSVTPIGVSLVNYAVLLLNISIMRALFYILDSLVDYSAHKRAQEASLIESNDVEAEKNLTQYISEIAKGDRNNLRVLLGEECIIISSQEYKSLKASFNRYLEYSRKEAKANKDAQTKGDQ